jgi:hypothetical protein
MDRDDIIRMAEEAGWKGPKDNVTFVAILQAYANLIAAAEREACAVIAFNAKTYLEAAAAIRARGQ